MEYFPIYLVTGVCIGGIYALIGLGVVIVYKATKVFNFTVGGLVALGGLVCVSFLDLGIPVWLGILLAIAVLGTVGLLLQRGVLDFFLQKPPLTAMIATCAFIYFLEGVSTLGWGGMPRSLGNLRKSLSLGGRG
jgi:branched-chain amino acid transport system permease protein